MSAEDVLVVDGSIGEGGGQILRNVVATAALLKRPVRIVNIRAKRDPPGLRPQHLSAVKGMVEITRGEVDGLRIGSMEILYRPGRIMPGRYEIDVGTAGSTTLMLQSLLPVISFADGEVELVLRGGTNNPWAPPVDYVQRVLLPVLRMMGVNVELELVRRGFYPRGMGMIRVRTRPTSSLRPINITSGRLTSVEVFAYTCNLPGHISERMGRRAAELLAKSGIRDVETITEALQRDDPKCSIDPGAGILIVAHLDNGICMGFDALGERGLPAEKVAEAAVNEMLRQLSTGAPIDKHLGDQLVIWVAIADGESTYRVAELTSHTHTAVEIARMVLGASFQVDGSMGMPATIKCRGIGLKAQK
jgi:RNA 3'-terminal phosphate cyclase (ATP)